MNRPLVSIIVPIYNVEKYLQECIDSLINQTLKNIEIICVNDGSTDNSLNILKEYAQKDNRIIVINKNNTGYGNSMNVGLEKASGEYIGIVESDDFAANDMFERLYEVAILNNAEIVKSNFLTYKSQFTNEKNFVEALKDCKYDYIFSPLDETNIFLATPSIWTAIYKKQLLIDNNIKFLETPGASYQDISFEFKVLACSKRVLLIKDGFLNYRVDNANSSVQSPEKIFCVCDEFDEIDRFLNSNPDKKDKLNSIKMLMKFGVYKWNYNRLATAFQYAFLMRMSQELKADYENEIFHRNYWSDEEFEELQLVINNYNKYYKITSKDYHDERMKLIKTLNFQVYSEGFFNYIKKYENIIIFGAGIIGTKVAKALIEKENKISYFAISDKNKNEKKVLDINVLCIDDLIDYKDNSIILVAVKEKDQYEIINRLQNLKFKNIVAIDSLLLKGLTS